MPGRTGATPEPAFFTPSARYRAQSATARARGLVRRWAERRRAWPGRLPVPAGDRAGVDADPATTAHATRCARDGGGASGFRSLVAADTSATGRGRCRLCVSRGHVPGHYAARRHGTAQHHSAANPCAAAVARAVANGDASADAYAVASTHAVAHADAAGTGGRTESHASANAYALANTHAMANPHAVAHADGFARANANANAGAASARRRDPRGSCGRRSPGRRARYPRCHHRARAASSRRNSLARSERARVTEASRCA
jgi:hypothetical protein